MSSKLKNIFEAITPDNIKNLTIIKDSMDIFIDALEELSKESIDITNIHENDLIKEELYKTYLGDLYNILNSIKTNERIINKIDEINGLFSGIEYYNLDAVNDVASYITEEHYLTNRTFKESKGTEAAIKYAYDLVNLFFKTPNTSSPFILEEIAPFQFEISGSLPAEIYNEVVRPLAHPLGFLYGYTQYILLQFVDYYPNENITYSVNELKVVCQLPGGAVEETDYKFYPDLITPRVVISIEEFYEFIDSDNNGSLDKYVDVRIIRFDDNTYLREEIDLQGNTVVYFIDDNNPSNNVEHTEQCSILDDIDIIFNPDKVTDTDMLAVDYKSIDENYEDISTYNESDSTSLTISNEWNEFTEIDENVDLLIGGFDVGGAYIDIGISETIVNSDPYYIIGKFDLLSDRSETFITSDTDLISDLPDIRHPDDIDCGVIDDVSGIERPNGNRDIL